jgi:hypothetical protein
VTAFKTPPGPLEKCVRAWAAIIAACGVGAAILFVLGETCGPNARGEAAWASVLLLGTASFLYWLVGAGGNGL